MAPRVVTAVALVSLVALAGCGSLGAGTGAAGGEDGGRAAGTPAPGAGTTVTVVEVVDGDTIDVRYANGTTDTVRLLGVDSPETRAENDPAEYEGVPDTEAGRACLAGARDAATAFAREQLAGERVRIVTDPAADRRGSFGRLLAYVQVDGVDFNYRLLVAGHARVYDSTFSRSERYDAAEREAQADRTGLWACRDPATAGDDSDAGAVEGTAPVSVTGLAIDAVHADAAGNDHENLNDEYVVFRNAGETTLGLGGWTVSDEAGHTYTFPAGTTLDPGDTVVLRTGTGRDTTGTRYWGRDRAVWNNGGDTVVVARDGDVVLAFEYG